MYGMDHYVLFSTNYKYYALDTALKWFIYVLFLSGSVSPPVFSLFLAMFQLYST